MEYQVPQFIEVEDKVVGPLTLKQFIYLAGGVGLCVAFFFELPLIFAVLLAIPVGGAAAALAFYKVNGKPLVAVVESAVSYYFGSKLFLWKHDDSKQATGDREQLAQAAQKAAQEAVAAKASPQLTRGKLSDLAWSLDVKEQQEPH